MTSDCASPKESLPEGIHRKGFPAPGALVAAALVHAAILALLLPWPPSPRHPETARLVAVRIVHAPPQNAETPPQAPVSAALTSKPARQARPPAAGGAAGAGTDPAARPGLQSLAEAPPPSTASEPEARPLEPGKPPRAAKGASHRAKPQGKPSPQRKSAGSGARGPAAAVYGVVLAGAGSVDSITLLQSSGRPDFDAAGEQMVRSRLRFPGPQDAGGATRYFTVTLRFSPDRNEPRP